MFLKAMFNRIEPSSSSARNSPGTTVSRVEMLSRRVCSGTELKCEGSKSLYAESECEKSKPPPAEFKCDVWKYISVVLKCDERKPLPEGTPLEVTKAIDKMPEEHVREEIVQVPVVGRQRRHVHAGHHVEVHVPMRQEEHVHVPVDQQELRHHHVHVDHHVDIHVTREQEEIVHVPVIQTQERIVQNPVEITVKVPNPQVLDRLNLSMAQSSANVPAATLTNLIL